MRAGCRAIVAAALVTLACNPAEVGAQPLVGATVGVSSQGAGASDAPYLGPPFGGTSLTSILMLDVPAGATVSVGGEATLAASISGTQSQRVGSFTSAEFESRHRDRVFSATVKAGMPFTGRVRAAAVGGFGAARRYTSRTGTVGSFSTPGISPYSATLTTWVPAATGGVDVAVHVAERVAILGTGRVHYLVDDDRQEDGVVRRGISSLIARIGAGVQIGF